MYKTENWRAAYSTHYADCTPDHLPPVPCHASPYHEESQGLGVGQKKKACKRGRGNDFITAYKGTQTISECKKCFENMTQLQGSTQTMFCVVKRRSLILMQCKAMHCSLTLLVILL